MKTTEAERDGLRYTFFGNREIGNIDAHDFWRNGTLEHLLDDIDELLPANEPRVRHLVAHIKDIDASIKILGTNGYLLPGWKED